MKKIVIAGMLIVAMLASFGGARVGQIVFEPAQANCGGAGC
jgi:hypothetical protein